MTGTFISLSPTHISCLHLAKSTHNTPEPFLLKKASPKNLPKCDSCGAKMKVIFVRDDECRYFECPECGATMGEETEEWFKKQKVSDTEKSCRKERI